MIRIGVRSFVAAVSGGGTDADAQAFITAAGITDATQQSAINTLVTDLKGYGVWTKMKAIYPFVGGTASTHKWNLKDPRDLDAAFRLVFSGGSTHSSTGWLPNGTNGYADTFLNQSTQLSVNSVHLSIYTRTNTSIQRFDIGGNSGSPNFQGAQLSSFYQGIGILGHLYSYPTDSVIAASPTTSVGFTLGSRVSSTSNKIYRNSSLLNTNTTARTSNLPNVSVKLATDDTTRFSNREFSLASIGDGLTDTEAANLYTAVQAYQTTLSRNV
jgi:hypothetical protein